MIKKLCVITDRYPTNEYPMNTFLDQLVCQFADMGIECTVVAPYSRILDRKKHNTYHPEAHYIKTTDKGSKISVYCPSIFALTGRKIGPVNFARVYQSLYNRAARRIVQTLKGNFDAFYGHFITPAGFSAAELGRLYHKPSFIAYGECFIDQDTRNFSIEEIRENLKSLTGVVAVSTKNRNELLEHKVIPEDKIEVFPNSVNSKSFYPMDKHAAREQLGFDQDDFILAYVGHFNERKGVLRVVAAIKGLEGVKSIFIGSGPQDPDCPGILFKGRLPHKDLVTYLNAADAFILPTQAEGCCNAIVEAMACGLPIISSALPFNDDILNDENSVRIDPDNVEEIRNAIRTLQQNRARLTDMAKASLLQAGKLTIENRALNISSFMEKMIDNG